MLEVARRSAVAALVVAAAVGAVVPVPTAQAAVCTARLGDGCGPYRYKGIPMSNGYDTYVSNQAVGANPGTRQTVTAFNPGRWSVTARDVPYGYTGVQTFPDTQQLTNDWCGHGWGACSKPANTPLARLSALSVRYRESSPRDRKTIYEFAADVWSNYASDVMFWVDTHGRCNKGAYGGTVLGTAVLGRRKWTVHRYGGAGAEIIFVLNGARGAGSCAQQKAGTIPIKAGFDWLAAHRLLLHPVISQLNTGWEIASADNTTFSMWSYSIIAKVGGGPGSRSTRQEQPPTLRQPG